MTPIPTPPVLEDTDYHLSGGGGFGWTVSGISPGSGISGVTPTGIDTSGPWFIETQWMDIYYTRVPVASRDQITNQNVSLSGVNTSGLGKNNNVNGTLISVRVVGQAIGTISNAVFPGPWQQPQKFNIIPVSADNQGRTYGDVTLGNLGPAGNIVTRQPFYQRRLAASGDEEYAQSCWKGYNFQLTIGWVGGGTNQQTFMGSPKKWLGWGIQGHRNTYLGECDGMDFYDPILSRSGGYSTAQDFATDARGLANECGSRLREGKLWDHALWTVTDKGAIYPLTEYNPSRHDFS